MPRSELNPWLHRFAVLTALATLALIGIGGLVTSHEAGLSVPDWPTSYGYNMFLFPISQWWHSGNVFYEHSHRLFASGVGLLTTILMVWLWLKESRRWLRWLGVIAFVAVVFQGVLGGLRVVWLKDEIGIFHAALAQLFFLLVCSIALFTSRWWLRNAAATLDHGNLRPLRQLLLFTTTMILFQLILGATMRHQHAGLSISDFPLAHGRLWPATDPESIRLYNQERGDTPGLNPVTAFQVQLQMAHRVTALAVLVLVSLCAWRSGKIILPAGNVLRRLSYLWLALVIVQAGLGAVTVLKNKPADIATTHVIFGALSLAVGGILCIVSARNPE